MSYVVPRWPAGASAEYMKARNDLLAEERAIRDQLEVLAEKRRALPEGALMKEYTFHEGPADIKSAGAITTVTLAKLAEDGRSVVMYHMMFADSEDEPCGMCASFVDALNGHAKHIGQRATLVVVGKAPIEKLRAFAAQRGWNQIRLLSSAESNFNLDMGVEEPPRKGFSGQQPGISVFKKDGEGKVRHVYSQSACWEGNLERGLDLMAPVWSVFDLIPEGRGSFYCRNDYMA